MAGDDVLVARGVVIPRAELAVRFSASGGPGGQHANKAATRVELVFDVNASGTLRPRQKALIVERLGSVVRVVADDERSQARNRVVAERRLADRLADALRVQSPRRPTRPSLRAKERRLRAKKRRSATKAERQAPGTDG